MVYIDLFECFKWVVVSGVVLSAISYMVATRVLIKNKIN